MIRNLLDTHTFLWFIVGNANLSAKALENIESENAENFISIVSL
jgi:PIN domain nuclease of toxin-antitoxin system